MAFDRATFDIKLGKSFKKVGKSYHIGRKDYPKYLIKDIINISGIKKDSLILDVGCGTGKSTIPFARKGHKIIGIDISENMLKIAKRLSINYKNAEYKQISFERFQLTPNLFNLILFGTSIHWLDSKMAYKKAGMLLKKNGYIALFFEPIGSLCKKIRALDMEEIFIRHCPYYPQNLSRSANKTKIEGIVKSKYFAKPLIKKYKFIHKYGQEEFLSLIKTYSWVVSLNTKKKNNLIREVKLFLCKNNNAINFRTEVYLIMARRK